MWIVNALCYTGCDIGLGSLSGNLALTMFGLGAIQTICCLTSGFLVLNYKEENLIKLTTVFMSFFFLLYIFEPRDKINEELWVAIIFSLLVVCGNIGVELNWAFFVNILQKVIPIEHQQNLFAFSSMSAMILNLLLPYYNEFMVSLSISPIFGFGILALFGRLCISFLPKENINKEENKLKNDVEVEITNENNYHLLEK